MKWSSITDWFTTRLFHLFILPNALFIALAIFVPRTWMIAACNTLIMSLAAGVCVSFSPVIAGIFFGHRPIDKADVMALGIFGGWLASFNQRAWSLVWRWYDQPAGWTEGLFIVYALYLTVWAAGFHLAAPATVGDRLPAREWVRIGVVCAVGVAVVMTAGWVMGFIT